VELRIRVEHFPKAKVLNGLACLLVCMFFFLFIIIIVFQGSERGTPSLLTDHLFTPSMADWPIDVFFYFHFKATIGNWTFTLSVFRLFVSLNSWEEGVLFLNDVAMLFYSWREGLKRRGVTGYIFNAFLVLFLFCIFLLVVLFIFKLLFWVEQN